MAKRAGIIKGDDKPEKPKRARHTGAAESYQGRGGVDESAVSHSSEPETFDRKQFRNDRVEVRRDYTTAAQAKGADGQGIAESTNWLYRILLGKKPKGDRDDWAVKDQADTMMGEHMATNRIKDLPTPKEGSSQRAANDKVVNASIEGAKAAKDLLEDKESSGAWGFLWNNVLNPPTIWDDKED